jgi:hypothetical protein
MPLVSVFVRIVSNVRRRVLGNMSLKALIGENLTLL